MSDQSAIRTTVLENGLTIIGEVTPHSKSSAIGFFVRTGSRDERSEESGISHFLEHMVFKGTASFSALELSYEMGRIGAQANAYTSEEATVYYAAVLPEHLPRMHELLAEMMRPTLEQHEYDTERNVILEEIALYHDRPQFYLFEQALGDFFGSHPAGNSVLGTTASIEALPRESMQRYHQERYVPSNMTLVAAGNFSWEQLLDDAQRFTAGWGDRPAPRAYPPFEAAGQDKTLRRKNLVQSHVLLLCEGCSAQDDERFPLAVLATILGDSSGSKLYWELVDSGIAESAGADNEERDRTGCFMAYASTEPGRIDQVSEILRRVLAAPLEFDDAELARAKAKLAAKLVLGSELPMGRLMALGNEFLYLRTVHELRALIDRVMAVERPHIEAALARFPLTSWREYRLVPEE